jgi:2-polyprenyl-3-methyl-5-hydroxy-6-metoxy-1,4-benzoquinol methylase
MKTTSEETTTACSPLSGLPSKKIRTLPKDFLLEQLERYYGAKPPAQIVECDYSLWQCAETGLQFCWPMRPGSADFYEWVSSFRSYYPGIRWEYNEVCRMLKAEALSNGRFPKVLDVGCGKGDFLRGLDSIPNEHKSAVDLNKPAVEACRQQGFQAYCGTLEMAMASGFIKAAEFPVVTSFHCLEHVPQPVAFVETLLQAVAPHGRLFLSTPYSPMSFEDDWFDIMNHPPHHMTRWNLNAYRRLAEMVGAKIRWFVPPTSALSQALNAFRLLHYGPHRNVSKPKLLNDLLGNFLEFLRFYQKQLNRKSNNGGISADVILIELTIS